MSKEKIIELNEKLSSLLERDGINDAFYYQPSDEYFSAPEGSKKIAFCNLETYFKKDGDLGTSGIRKFPDEYFTYDEKTKQDWSFNKTIRWTELFNFVLELEMNGNPYKEVYTGKVLEQDPIIIDVPFLKMVNKDKYSDEKKWSFLDFAHHFAYFNFRFTAGKGSAQHGSDIRSLYCLEKDDYRKFFKDYVKALECNVVVLGGKISAELISVIYKDEGFCLKYGEMKWHDNILFVSIRHPSRIGYEYVVKKADEITGFFCLK